MKKTWEQTAGDYDKNCFGNGAFAASAGNMQSLTFALAAVGRLLQGTPVSKTLQDLSTWSSEPTDLVGKSAIIKGMDAVIYDIGCAEGDGTAALSYMFPLSTITGIDISPVAIEHARARWPHLKFEVGDIHDLQFNKSAVILVSHTIEHMEFPAAVVKDLMARCDILVVVVPPILVEAERITHCGAKVTAEWLSELPEPLYETAYTTIRPDLDHGGVIEESNILLVWYTAP